MLTVDLEGNISVMVILQKPIRNGITDDVNGRKDFQVREIFLQAKKLFVLVPANGLRSDGFMLEKQLANVVGQSSVKAALSVERVRITSRSCQTKMESTSRILL